MTVFGLLHGWGFGAWSWDVLRPHLEANGHTTLAVELPLESESLAANVRQAGRAFGEHTEGLVLVGHAAGCALLPLVAAATSASRMAWVCGIIPVASMSCADQVAADPDMVPMFAGRRHDEIGPRSPQALAESLFPDCD